MEKNVVRAVQQISSVVVEELSRKRRPPCLSIYQPTHKRFPGVLEDPKEFKNLVRDAEKTLLNRYQPRIVEPILAKLRPYERDRDFWAHQTGGLAFFASPDLFRVIEFNGATAAIIVASENFHIKPLLRVIQSADRFHVLCLCQKRVSLYEGTRYGLEEVELQDVPRTMTEALGTDLTQPFVRVAAAAGPGAPGIRSGQGDASDEEEKDSERYFRAVDRAIWDKYSKSSGLPLILAALAEDQSLFRRISHNRNLIPKGIKTHPGELDKRNLPEQAWQAYEPIYRDRLSKAVDRYQAAKAHQAGSDDMLEVARAAKAGRIDTLLVEAERHIPGKVDEQGVSPLPVESGANDLLDDIAEEVLAKGGRVFVIPPEHMPSQSGIAAAYRF